MPRNGLAPYRIASVEEKKLEEKKLKERRQGATMRRKVELRQKEKEMLGRKLCGLLHGRSVECLTIDSRREGCRHALHTTRAYLYVLLCLSNSSSDPVLVFLQIKLFAAL